MANWFAQQGTTAPSLYGMSDVAEKANPFTALSESMGIMDKAIEDKKKRLYGEEHMQDILGTKTEEGLVNLGINPALLSGKNQEIYNKQLGSVRAMDNIGLKGLTRDYETKKAQRDLAMFDKLAKIEDMQKQVEQNKAQANLETYDAKRAYDAFKNQYNIGNKAVFTSDELEAMSKDPKFIAEMSANPSLANLVNKEYQATDAINYGFMADSAKIDSGLQTLIDDYNFKIDAAYKSNLPGQATLLEQQKNRAIEAADKQKEVIKAKYYGTGLQSLIPATETTPVSQPATGIDTLVPKTTDTTKQTLPLFDVVKSKELKDRFISDLNVFGSGNTQAIDYASKSISNSVKRANDADMDMYTNYAINTWENIPYGGKNSLLKETKFITPFLKNLEVAVSDSMIIGDDIAQSQVLNTLNDISLHLGKDPSKIKEASRINKLISGLNPDTHYKNANDLEASINSDTVKGEQLKDSISSIAKGIGETSLGKTIGYSDWEDYIKNDAVIHSKYYSALTNGDKLTDARLSDYVNTYYKKDRFLESGNIDFWGTADDIVRDTRNDIRKSLVHKSFVMALRERALGKNWAEKISGDIPMTNQERALNEGIQKVNYYPTLGSKIERIEKILNKYDRAAKNKSARISRLDLDMQNPDLPTRESVKHLDEKTRKGLLDGSIPNTKKYPTYNQYVRQLEEYKKAMNQLDQEQ